MRSDPERSRALSLATGARLGPYEIVAPIGAGGMGEVYRARDARLGRDVAIKVLPTAFAEDAERLARFEREARLLAALNHSNIAHVYGFETASVAEGRRAHFLAMELVEGEDLAERLKRGPVPVDEAIAIARQVAEALEGAHEKGIVHRDLKPGNIKLAPDGKVKVLDFGLAKAWDGPGASSADLSQSPTLAHTGTAAGLILGTAAYMSPEQARGKSVDKRSDIWAFGVVLYEMLSGRQPFAGETVSDVLAGVLKTEIDLGKLPESTPPAIRRLLRRCLERDLKRRLHDIADARIVLEDVVSGIDGEATAAASGGSVVATRARRASLPWLAAFVVTAAGAGLAGYLARGRGTAPVEPMRLAIQLGAGQELGTGGELDDRLLARRQQPRLLGTRGREAEPLPSPAGGAEATPIPGTEGGDSPFFSPDGRWIGFVAESQMRKVPAEGGRPFSLGEARGAGGSAWLPDDTIVYAPIYSEGLYRVPAEGGSPERLTTPDHEGGELGHWWPEPLPGGQRVLFTAFRTPVDRSRIGVLDLATREVRWVVDGGFFGRYVSSGHLLYAKGQRLYALPFDPVAATAGGAAVAVVDDVHASQTSGYAQVAVSSRGTLAYVSESLGNPLRELVWIDRTGRAVAATSDLRRFLSASLSPDGRRAALTIQGESRDLWTLSLERGTLSRLTSGEGTEYDPVWTRDGKELLYVVDRPPYELHRIAAGAPDSGRPLWDEPAKLDTNRVAVSPDGRTIAFTRTEEKTGANLYARPIDGSEPPQHDPRQPRRRALCLVFPRRPLHRLPVGRDRAPGGLRRGDPGLRGAGPGVLRRRERAPVGRQRRDLLPARRRGPGRRGSPSRAPRVRRAALSLRLPDRRRGQRRIADVRRHARRRARPGGDHSGPSRPRRIEIVTDWTSELARLAPRGGR